MAPRAKASAFVRASSLLDRTMSGTWMGFRIGAIITNQGKPVYLRHNQILQNHRRVNPVGRLYGLGRILTVVKIDIPLGRQHATDGLADDVLIVHKQHGDMMAFQGKRICHFCSCQCGLRDLLKGDKAASDFFLKKSRMAGAMRLMGRISTAAPSSLAAFGMPYTTLVASSCAMVYHPALLSAASPSGAVPAHSRQKDRDPLFRPVAGHAFKKKVYGRPVWRPFGLRRVNEGQFFGDNQMIVAARQKNRTRQGLAAMAMQEALSRRSGHPTSLPGSKKTRRQHAERSPPPRAGSPGSPASNSAKALGPPVEEPMTIRGGI